MSDLRNIRIMISCPDRTGIIAAVSGFIGEHGGNILEADQHTDPDSGEFFMRLEVAPEGFRLTRETFGDVFQSLAQRLNLASRLWWPDRQRRVVLLASREGHCLFDLLYRWRSGEMLCEIPAVISNHAEHAKSVREMGVEFHHLPVSPGDTDSKVEQEARIEALFHDYRADVIVLARYMQILSPELVRRWQGRIINIHHSFLPAFPGPRPYARAHQRGVKIIGATSHYVTEDLDEGPIIAQETSPVGHRHTVADLVRLGRDLERIVLARAVRLHLEDKVLIAGQRTVVFD
jgi:formyltetrahydrofolate deformylase